MENPHLKTSVDADRPMAVLPRSERASYVIESHVPEKTNRAYSSVLIYALVAVSDELDKIEIDPQWRISVYKHVFDAFMANNHAGTGSQEERDFIRGLDTLAQALCIRQAE